MNIQEVLISFRSDWFDLLAVQGTLKCLLQRHSLKASILQHSAFFTVQLWHPHIKMKVKSLSHVQLFVTPWTIAHQSSLSMGFSRKSTGVGCLFLLYSPTLTSTHDYWKIHCFDYMDLCRQSDVSFLTSFFKNSTLSSKILHTIKRSFSCCCFHRLSLLISSPLIVP